MQRLWGEHIELPTDHCQSCVFTLQGLLNAWVRRCTRRFAHVCTKAAPNHEIHCCTLQSYRLIRVVFGNNWTSMLRNSMHWLCPQRMWLLYTFVCTRSFAPNLLDESGDISAVWSSLGILYQDGMWWPQATRNGRSMMVIHLESNVRPVSTNPLLCCLMVFHQLWLKWGRFI